VTKQSKPDPIRKTAQSSPIPTAIALLAAAVSRLPPVDETSWRSFAISFLSGSGMAALNYTAGGDFDWKWGWASFVP
jgi:hypothetical protein